MPTTSCSQSLIALRVSGRSQTPRLRRLLPGVLFLMGCGFGAPDNTYQPPPPPEVTVAQPVQQTVTLFVEENGETEVVERAEVRSRVRGFLKEIRFQPGQEVAEGDVLYVIEQSEYQATVNSSKAALEAADAAIKVAESQVGVTSVEVTRAEIDFDRYKSLLEKDAATKSQYDEALAARDAAVATREAATAAVAAAQAERDKAAANLEQAQLDLDYTLVKAPISGRITKTALKRGNLVENGSLMATVVDRSRIYANFNLDDRTLLRLQKAMREDDGGAERDAEHYRTMPAYLQRELDEGFPFKGRLDYVDQEGVDQATGTFAIRAVFENPEDWLLPGLFVRVRVPIGEEEGALLIPERALARDQLGAFVLVVNDEQKVERRPVTPGQTFAGMIVIEQGLGPNDWVLLDGGQRARPGIEVSPDQTQLSEIPMLGDEESTATPTKDIREDETPTEDRPTDESPGSPASDDAADDTDSPP